MKILSWKELRSLIYTQDNPAVSIYMPTSPKGNNEQDPIRLKNLLREADNQLSEYDLRSPDIRKLLAPVRQLLTDLNFWKHQGDGLALFLTPVMFRYYRLPCNFQEVVVVSERLHLKPLLSLFNEDEIFYLLAISQNKARLLQCTRHHVREITPEKMPSSLAEALKYDDPEKQVQFHTSTPPSDGKRSAIFHGHRITKDYDKINIMRYFQAVDKELCQQLKEEHAPLIIAAVDYLHSIYRETNNYPYLINEGIQGNPDSLSEEALKDQALKFVQPYFEHRKTGALKQYNEAAFKGLATSDLGEVVLSASDGRVSTLFVAKGVHRWGLVDTGKRTVYLSEKEEPGAEDLLDFAAVNTIIGEGFVYTLDLEQMPDNKTAAAILKY